MLNKFLISFGIIAILGIVVFMTNCSDGSKGNCQEIPDLFKGKEISQELLDQYMLATSSNTQENGTPSNEVRIYVDKSSGINEAFSSPIGGDKAKALLTAIVASNNNAKYFKVLEEIEAEIMSGVPTNFYDKANNYEPVDGKSAALGKALDEITDNNGLSFFITDGEEFDANGEENNKGDWAGDAMKKWISKGNTIHFWITNFEANNKKTKRKVQKHLFFMAFVPANKTNEKSFTDLVADLTKLNSVHLELSNTSWQMLTPTWSEQSTGLDANLLKPGVFEKDNYIRHLDYAYGSYEFMSILLPIIPEALTVQGALTRPQFYRDMFINLSNNKFFDINKIDFDVTDVSNDLNNYAKFYEISSNQPNPIKDKSNNKTILNPEHAYSCFYEYKNDKVELKSENKYSKNYDLVLKELFQFDEEIFKYSMKDNTSKVEMGIKFHDKFNPDDSKLTNNLGYNIIRVDFKISNFIEKSIEDLSYFSWDSYTKASEKNEGFAKGIQSVIRSTAPKDKVIHTLFIKFIKK